MGFSEKWVNRVMLCVTTVSYSICFHWSNVGPIISRRGLRQGDPLLPYIFLLCVEVCRIISRKHLERKGA